MQPRVGHINFLNCLPLTFSLLQCGYHHGMDLLLAVPAVLNKGIVQHHLDVSPMSSFAFGASSRQLLLLPNMGIVADGQVQSIILASKIPIEKLDKKRVFLTAQSATSHCLLKIILQKRYAVQPIYEIGKVSPKAPFASNSDAVLLIGDDALFVNYHRQAGIYYYDLGELWKQMTGLCMVYAVWAADADFASSQPQLLKKVYSRLRQGITNGEQEREAVLKMSDGRTAFSRAQISAYLDVIHYDVGSQQLQALRQFYTLAVQCGFLEKMPRLAVADI